MVLSTLAAAEQLYDALSTRDTGHPPSPRDGSDANIRSLFRAVRSQHHPRNILLRYRLRLRVDLDHVLAPLHSNPRICRWVSRHCRVSHTDGGLAEQFNKASGAPASVADLYVPSSPGAAAPTIDREPNAARRDSLLLTLIVRATLFLPCPPLHTTRTPCTPILASSLASSLPPPSPAGTFVYSNSAVPCPSPAPNHVPNHGPQVPKSQPKPTKHARSFPGQTWCRITANHDHTRPARPFDFDDNSACYSFLSFFLFLSFLPSV